MYKTLEINGKTYDLHTSLATDRLYAEEFGISLMQDLNKMTKIYSEKGASSDCVVELMPICTKVLYVAYKEAMILKNEKVPNYLDFSMGIDNLNLNAMNSIFEVAMSVFPNN